MFLTYGIDCVIIADTLCGEFYECVSGTNDAWAKQITQYKSLKATAVL